LVIVISAVHWVYWYKAVAEFVNVLPIRVWDTLVQQENGVGHFQLLVIIIAVHHPARILRLACDGSRLETTIRLLSLTLIALGDLKYLLIIIILNF
jgi:hypothetical protein